MKLVQKNLTLSGNKESELKNKIAFNKSFKVTHKSPPLTRLSHFLEVHQIPFIDIGLELLLPEMQN